jgi:proton-translocating NADH-quinone oxidoreductase chain N
MAIASYLLVAFYRERPATLEAGVKYLVQSAAGSVLVLLAIALVFGATGQLELDSVQTAVSSPIVLMVAAALFTIGFGVKIALVPLHTWLPDAHSQAPSGISAMLSGVVIEAGLVALLRALTALAGLTLSWGIMLLAFGALNMLTGNLLALRQRQVKRLLAYSSLSHMGYILVGLGIGLYAGEAAGAEGGLFHLLNHGLMKGLAFLAAGAFLYVLSDSGHSLAIADLAGAARRYPLPALAFSLALLGLAGLPPLAGFMSKWQIFAAGFATHNILVVGVIFFAALNSVLSLAYYAPLVNVVYRREPSAAIQQGRPMPVSMVLPLLLLTAAIVLIGVWPGSVAWLTEAAAETVLVAFEG